MIKDISIYFEDILESVKKIQEYTTLLTEEEFDKADSIRDAVLMRLAVIGESTSKIPTEIRDKYPAIAWRKIIALRNIIVHDYTNIDTKRIWSVIQTDIPEFQKQMIELFKKVTDK